jgi:hypothetical protein
MAIAGHELPTFPRNAGNEVSRGDTRGAIGKRMLQSCRKLDCITSPKVTDGSSLMLTSIVPDPTMSVAEPPSGRAAVRRRAASTPCENGQMERGGGYQAGLAQDGDERIGKARRKTGSFSHGALL